MRAAWKVLSIVVAVAITPLSAGCAPLPGLRNIGAYSNEELHSTRNDTSATFETPKPPDYFIGLALSGGGSRAANFSASVMWELDQLGVLQHVQYISAVSGSSLPAAYYALFKHNRQKWERAEIRRVMKQCFECWLGTYLLNPFRLLKFLGTSYDRSDVMARVFDDRVFQGSTFGDLTRPTPHLILNATHYIFGRPFRFTNGEFDLLKSDLKRFRIANAVMASAAYPAGFRNVTLRDFRSSLPGLPHYVHLFDGGVSDNLGIDTLLEIHDSRVIQFGESAFKNGCLFIVVDAYTPFKGGGHLVRPDTQEWYDFPIDFSNAEQAFSVLLGIKRERMLRSLGFDLTHWMETHRQTTGSKDRWRPIGFLESIKAERLIHYPTEMESGTIELLQRKRAKCKVWHISLLQIGLAGFSAGPPPLPLPENLMYLPGTYKLPELYESNYEQRHQPQLKVSYEEFRLRIRSVPTRFWISSARARSLHVAGELLVQEENSRRIICEWLKEITRSACSSRAAVPQTSK